MLNRLQLRRVRRHDISRATRGRALRCILNLSAGQRLRHLLVFALILNFDVRCRGGISVRIDPITFTLVVVDLANLMHALLLAHIQSLVRTATDGRTLRQTVRTVLTSHYMLLKHS